MIVENRYITSDCAAVAIIHDRQGYAKTPEDAVADTLKAGIYILTHFLCLCHNQVALIIYILPLVKWRGF